MKRFSSILLALVVAFAMSTTAFAVTGTNNDNGTITINNAVANETYKVYQILKLESYDTENGAYAYKANSAWENWLKNQTTYVSFDDQGYVTWVTTLTCTEEHTHTETCYTAADAAAFAAAAIAYAQDSANNISATDTKTADSTTVTFTDLNLGYYLVDSSLGALCALTTTQPNATVNEKNEGSNVDKQVQEDSKVNDIDQGWGKVNDADVGDTVNFKANVTLKKGATNVVFHDKMEDGLTFNTSPVVVKVGDSTLTAGTDYTFVSAPTDGCTFEIKFADSYLSSLTADTTVVITYSAVLNENAVVSQPEKNTDYLTYGDNQKTTENITKTYTWGMDVLKYANGDESKVLEGVKFVLLNSDKSKVATVANGKLTGWVTPEAVDGKITWPENAVLTTDSNGKISIDGLDADTYYLREIEPLDGYNVPADDFEAVVTATKSADGLSMSYTRTILKVNNQSGTELPSTGGMGTTIFYALGGVLVLAAVVLLVTRKRMNREG